MHVRAVLESEGVGFVSSRATLLLAGMGAFIANKVVSDSLASIQSWAIRARAKVTTRSCIPGRPCLSVGRWWQQAAVVVP